MIKLPHKQGSQEWHQARLGIPTASCFDKIITPKTGKLSAQSKNYVAQLVADVMCGYPTNDFVSEFMERGKELEPKAVAEYERIKGVKVDLVGLCTLDDGSAGCSPDGLVGDSGGLEIKAPLGKEHVLHAINPAEFVATHQNQVQGSIWITGRKWWDLMSYHPDMPAQIIRVERDEDRIEQLRIGVELLCADVRPRLEEMNA